MAIDEEDEPECAALYNDMLSIHEAGITFLGEQCNLLLSCIKPVVEEVKILTGNKRKKQEAEILVEKATTFVTDCKVVMEKCRRKGVFKREYAGISQQKKWQKRFSELYKTLSELHLQVKSQEEVNI